MRGLFQIVGVLPKQKRFGLYDYKIRNEIASLKEHLNNGISCRFDFTFEAVGDTTSVNNSPFAEKVLSELDGISALSITDEQKSRMNAINAKFAEIDDPDFLKNFYAMTVVPFAKECRAYHKQSLNKGQHLHTPANQGFSSQQ